MNADEVLFVAGDERGRQGDCHRGDEKVEAARFRVAAGGSHTGAKGPRKCAASVRIERHYAKGVDDPVIPLFARGVDQRIRGVQAVGQFGERVSC